MSILCKYVIGVETHIYLALTQGFIFRVSMSRFSGNVRRVEKHFYLAFTNGFLFRVSMSRLSKPHKSNSPIIGCHDAL